MYTEKAIERLNNINWDNIGKNGQKRDLDYLKMEGTLFIVREE